MTDPVLYSLYLVEMDTGELFSLLGEVVYLTLHETIDDVVILIRHALDQSLLRLGLGLGVGGVDNSAGGGVDQSVHEGLVDQVVGLLGVYHLGVLVLAGVEVAEGAVFAVQFPTGETHLLGHIFTLAAELHHRGLLVIATEGTGGVGVGLETPVVEGVGAQDLHDGGLQTVQTDGTVLAFGGGGQVLLAHGPEETLFGLQLVEAGEGESQQGRDGTAWLHLD